jgi:hypothetical protein
MAFMKPLFAALIGGLLLAATPSSGWAQHEDDDDGDNVLESDEVSGDAEEGEEGSETVIRIKDTDPSAVVIFHDELAPHGTWVDHPTYGMVWVPSSSVVGAEFAPYVSGGHWELTEEGDWIWVSDYAWGHIPFHYGRWVWVSGLGWAWIPGRVYAPAWVVWRTGPSGYIGWAPMPPAYYWVDGYAVSFWVVPPAPFVFCHSHHVFHHHVHTYVVHDHDEVRRAASATTTYTPASPKRKYQPASPSLQDAGVDPKSSPKSYTKHDERALKYMRPEAKRSVGSTSKGGVSRAGSKESMSKAGSKSGFTAPKTGGRVSAGPPGSAPKGTRSPTPQTKSAAPSPFQRAPRKGSVTFPSRNAGPPAHDSPPQRSKPSPPSTREPSGDASPPHVSRPSSPAPRVSQPPSSSPPSAVQRPAPKPAAAPVKKGGGPSRVRRR